MTQCVAASPLTDEAVLCLQGLFSQERSRSEPEGGVQPIGEGQAAHELQAAHGLQAVDEGQTVHELQAAHGLPYSH